jgi:hypothetical protein
MNCHFRNLAFAVCILVAGSGRLWPQAPPGHNHQQQRGLATVGPFEFHSGFWINLHHFLYQQALENSPESLHAGAALTGGELSESEKTSWTEALAFYRHSIVEHDLLLDPGMNAIDTVLGDAEGSDSLDGSGLKDDLVKALEEAAPVYRAHWWSAHDKFNRFWITAVTPAIQELGPDMEKQLAAAFQVPWPPEPVRVDVAVYANWAGAYTYTSEHVHTVISSTCSGYQGFAAFEMLFHEACHGLVAEDSGYIAGLVAAEAKSDGIPAPPDLIHAMIFFTAGEFARRDLASVGVGHYQPYALNNGLYARADWTRYKSAFELFWMPHLNGKAPLDVSVVEVVDALAVGHSPAVAHAEPASKDGGAARDNRLNFRAQRSHHYGVDP